MWIIIALASLAVLIILTLCVPLEAALTLNIPARPGFQLRLVWLYGLLSKELSRGRAKPEKKEKPRKERPKKKGGPDFSTILKILRTRGLLRKTMVLVRDLLRQFRFRELSLNLRLGLTDPADTGIVLAMVSATTPFLNLPDKYQFRLEPAFSDGFTFDGRLHGVIRVQPIRLSWPLLKFIFSLTTFRVIKTLVTSRWKRRK